MIRARKVKILMDEAAEAARGPRKHFLQAAVRSVVLGKRILHTTTMRGRGIVELNDPQDSHRLAGRDPALPRPRRCA